tara:strand:- start:726 stop:1175 length:450 start_codon:yes stop_codon:yes gene_type:complete
MDIFKDLYQQLIIDHNQNPQNYYSMLNATHVAEGHNPLCGDQMKVFLRINKDVIEEISFQGNGCAISKASASIMTTVLASIKITDAQEIFKIFHKIITSGNIDNKKYNIDKLEVLGGVYKYPSRVKCASLAWHTFQGALKKTIELIKTE